MSPRISLHLGGQTFPMAARPEPRSQRAFLVPTFLLMMALFTSWRVLSSSFLRQLDDDDVAGGRVGGQPPLKGSVTKADRLPSWMRARAIDKLPYYMNRSHVPDGYLDEIKNALFPKHGNNETVNQTIVDVITIGTVDRIKYMHSQQKAWASNKHSVRNVFISTERNLDDLILPVDANCQELIRTCPFGIDVVEDPRH